MKESKSFFFLSSRLVPRHNRKRGTCFLLLLYLFSLLCGMCYAPQRIDIIMTAEGMTWIPQAQEHLSLPAILTMGILQKIPPSLSLSLTRHPKRNGAALSLSLRLSVWPFLPSQVKVVLVVVVANYSEELQRVLLRGKKIPTRSKSLSALDEFFLSISL